MCAIQEAHASLRIASLYNLILIYSRYFVILIRYMVTTCLLFKVLHYNVSGDIYFSIVMETGSVNDL